MSISLVYVTTESVEEARRIGHALIEDRLVACVNILDRMTSIYRWEGAVEEGREAVLIAKTRKALVGRVGARIADLHGAELPCALEIEVAGGHAPFIDWIEAETE